MKKSAEILGLPIISITEGAELGKSKTLLIDAKNELVAAITVEDDDWYRGVKLIPYESVTAIGEDAITIMQSENILSFDEAGAYESLLRDNIHVKGTRAITKSGRLEGVIAEIYIGDDGKIVKCDIEAPDGTIIEVTLDKIAKFGKKVTVIDPDGEKKNDLVAATEPVRVSAPTPEEDSAGEVVEEPVEEVVEEVPAEVVAEEVPADEISDADEGSADEDLEAVMTPDPVEENPVDEAEFEPPVIEEPVPVEEDSEAEDVLPEGEEEVVEPILVPETEPEPGSEPESEAEPPKVVTQQAEALKAALKRAMEKGGANKNPQQPNPNKKQIADDRRRSMLLGKKASKTIKADTGAIIVEEGAEITEEVLQKAKLAGKFIDLSMNYVS